MTLANGMRVVVHTDRRAPLVAVGVMVNVGARNEEKGLSGLAHFFEHMMFQGSAHTAPMEHVRLVEAQGGDVNANTSSDRTFFYEVVPRPALQLALWLEAERLQHLTLTEAGVATQRAAVLAEMAERIDQQPGARTMLAVEEQAYQNWALGHPTIGSADDLKAAPLQAFSAFFTRWYAPSNCVVVLSGDIDLTTAKPLLEATLAKVTARAQPENAQFAVHEPQAHTGTVVVESQLATPRLYISWPIPAWPDADAPALDLLAMLLGDGPASRLEQRLVRKRPLVTSFQASTHGRRDRDLFTISADLVGASPKAVAEVEAAIWTEVFAIAQTGVTAAELNRAQTSFQVAWLQAAQAPMTRAELLADAEIRQGDANKLAVLLPKYRTVTPDDIRRVARRWLGWHRASTVVGVPVAMAPVQFLGEPAAVQQLRKQIAAEEAAAQVQAMRAQDEATRKAAERPAPSPTDAASSPDAPRSAGLPDAATPTALPATATEEAK